jgi:hypothetical protein
MRHQLNSTTSQMRKRTRSARAQTGNKAEQAAAQPPSPSPTREQVQSRAYELFKARGGEPGRALDDWLLAEYELKTAIERRIGKSAE